LSRTGVSVSREQSAVSQGSYTEDRCPGSGDVSRGSGTCRPGIGPV